MIFVNYVGDRFRSSPINLAVARMLLGGYLIWKTVWYDWSMVVAAPFSTYAPYRVLLPPTAGILTAEKWLAIVLLAGVIVGYRLGLTTFLSAVLLTHLGAIRFTLNSSGGTTALLLATCCLVFFGLYRDQDVLSADGLRRTRRLSIAELNDHLKSSPPSSYPTNALRYSLVVLAIVYFGAGFDKLAVAGLGWGAPENLSRIVLLRNAVNTLPLPIGPALLDYPLLMQASAYGSLFLEIGFLIAVVLGVTITPFVLGIFGMQAAIAVLIGPFFFDIYPLFALFFVWDGLFDRFRRTREIDLVYDERCYFCTQSLYPFKVLDTRETVTFYSQSDMPDRYRHREDTDFGSAMYVFADGEAYGGYYAFRELLRQFGMFAPLVRLMNRSAVAWVGTRLYSYVAANRSRYFTCSIDDSSRS